MADKILTSDDYVIFNEIDNINQIYAVHKDQVAKMNRMKDTYANNAVPDELTVTAYRVVHISVTNNVVTDYDLESDKSIKVQINLLEPYIIAI
ncbi:MAG: hypothetical protein C0599_14100 [Salinivirgaceae bacterium]|nr:MAG: hypothetical protein C0599_14100 [Salinivirgaceae bacterium]